MSYQKISDTFTLSNGVAIPCVGFGTWQVADDENTVNVIVKAIELGYRHIDTAAAYYNEKSVGKALKKCGVKRDELFVTSKLWNADRNLGYEETIKAFSLSLKNLQLDYLDLYLIHWPANELQFKARGREINAEVWKAFEELYEDKKIRAIGVSNFLTHHLEGLLTTAKVKPMVDQIEYHPGYTQSATVEFCKKNGILVEAWSPLGSGRSLALPELQQIADKHKKSVAQVCLRWCLQTGTLPLPKSVTESRFTENTKIFDFELSAEDVKVISTISESGFSGFHPDTADF
jgi:diketogulonate reductase-like aldo/keto reductase